MSTQLFVTSTAELNHLELPVRCDFIPQPDITAYELALLLPYFINTPLLKHDLEKLGSAIRHLEIVK